MSLLNQNRKLIIKSSHNDDEYHFPPVVFQYQRKKTSESYFRKWSILPSVNLSLFQMLQLHTLGKWNGGLNI